MKNGKLVLYRHKDCSGESENMYIIDVPYNEFKDKQLCSRIWSEIYPTLLEGYDFFVRCEASDWRNILRQKYFPARSAKRFSFICYVDKVTEYIDENPSLLWCEEQYKQTDTRDRTVKYGKDLYVYSEKIEPDLVRILSDYDESPGFFYGYPKGYTFEEIKKFSRNFPPKYAIECGGSLISINPEIYPYKQLIDRIKTVTDMYNVELEIEENNIFKEEL